MKNRKGMTLVEIIVAMGLLGIIAVSVLMALTGYVTYISRTKGITQDIFVAQDGLETEIREVKSMIRTGTVSGYSAESFEIFGRTLDGYTLQEVVDQHELNTVVGSGLEIEFEVPEVATIDADLYRGSSIIATNHAYGADIGGVALRATGAYSIAPGEPSFIDKVQWYVSRDGYSLPMTASPMEIEIGSVYPRFPEDYIPIPGATFLTLNGLEAYVGHHVVFSVTPVASSLKMGSMANSAPLYIDGPPVLTNLKLHLNASLLSRDDTTSIRIDGTDAWIKSWPNLASAITTPVLPNAIQTSTTLQPLLEDVTFDGNTFPGVWGRQAVSAAVGSGMSIAVPSSSLRTTNAMTVILVAKTDPALGTSPVLQGYNWSVGRTVADGALGITSGTRRMEPSDATLGFDGEWHVYVGIWNVTNTSTGKGTLTFQVDKEEFTQLFDTGLASANQFSTGMSIRSDGIDIAEMMVYYQNLQDTEELEQIKTYLFSKYMPEITPWSIRQLYPLSDTIELGGTLSLPPVVAARLMDGSHLNVAVNWEPATVDTTVAGSFDYVATAEEDPTKNTIMSVGVIGIDDIEDVSVTCFQLVGESYLLPLTVDALFMDGITRPTQIDWDSSSISRSTTGVFVVHGVSAYDASKTVDFRLEVISRPVTGVTLNKSTLYLLSTGTIYRNATLIATVTPPDAPDTSVNWTTSNAAVATVVNGTVQGVGTGTAIITATSNSDPGVSATCTVHVNKQAVLSSLSGLKKRNSGGTPTTLGLSPTPPTATSYTAVLGKSSATQYYNRFTLLAASADPGAIITVNAPSGFSFGNYYTHNNNTTITVQFTVSAPGMVNTVYTVAVRQR